MAPHFFVSVSRSTPNYPFDPSRPHNHLPYLSCSLQQRGKKKEEKKTLLATIKQRESTCSFSIFARRYANQETQSSPTKEYAPPLTCLLLNFDFCRRPSLFIHSLFFFHCHRSTGGALWTTTRINARMLGSHERRQIYRALQRPCPGSL